MGTIHQGHDVCQPGRQGHHRRMRLARLILCRRHRDRRSVGQGPQFFQRVLECRQIRQKRGIGFDGEPGPHQTQGVFGRKLTTHDAGIEPRLLEQMSQKQALIQSIPCKGRQGARSPLQCPGIGLEPNRVLNEVDQIFRLEVEPLDDGVQIVKRFHIGRERFDQPSGIFQPINQSAAFGVLLCGQGNRHERDDPRKPAFPSHATPQGTITLESTTIE